MSDIAEKILKLKYTKDKDETWEQLAWRVASYVAQPEGDRQDNYAKQFYKIIAEKFFIPGGRILKNSGTGIKNLFNCFFMNIEDSRESIYQVLKDSAEVFAWGGGLGIRISELREEGALIKTSNTPSSGAVSFLELFNLTGDVIQQASRRAAEIALLDIKHPDILKFINYKSILSNKNKLVYEDFIRRGGKDPDKILEKTLIENQLSHFNISVEVTNGFMEAVINDSNWELISPSTGEVVEVVSARELLRTIAESIWRSGDPGLFFVENVKEDNMVNYISDIVGTNPCGEINLLSYEPCDLGSLNLVKFVDEKEKKIDFELMSYVISLAVRFLDNIHDLSENRVEKINKMSRGLRRVGLGVMGWADMLALLEIPYDSEEALKLGEFLSKFISFMAWKSSNYLAYEKGAFPLFDFNKANLTVIKKLGDGFISDEFIEDIKNYGLRNVSVTALAPTGSIALLGGVNSCIEPYFALAYRRYVTEGIGNFAKDTIIEVNPILKKKLEEIGIYDQVKEKILKEGSIQKIEQIPENIRKVFKTAHDISPLWHIKMQSVWQSGVSNAISKTINLPHNSTPEDIYNYIIQMWKNKLKSSTFYRDGSKDFQILNVGTN